MKAAPENTIESLELRRLLSGSVSTSLQDGPFLQIRGDGAANQLVVEQRLNRDVVITGQEGTRINGRSSVTYRGVSLKDLDIKLFGGSDRLTLRGLVVSNDLNVELFSGDDRAYVTNVQAKVFKLYGGDGSDTVTVSNLRTRSDANFDTGNGLSTIALSGSNIAGSLTLIGGSSADNWSLSSVRVGKDLNVESKEGSDTIRATTSSAFKATFNTDTGNDRVTLSGFAAAEDLNVETGTGNDVVRLIDTRSGKVLSVKLDVGNDFLEVRNVRAADKSELLGGDGYDTLDNNGLFGSREIKEFNRFI